MGLESSINDLIRTKTNEFGFKVTHYISFLYLETSNLAKYLNNLIGDIFVDVFLLSIDFNRVSMYPPPLYTQFVLDGFSLCCTGVLNLQWFKAFENDGSSTSSITLV